ncbi:replication protein [Halieaceae bacterium IMCC14734]|uniref:Replication protein n=1 Tax=Candidatus Litorirhabdus singularis TaxID=2518993 RepID=A0ABT3TP28_9GAMM|nr:poly-gamma-glutamate hydrolase family protein [Candidatus Litorirhabdus singularis]MCX2983144.1 replication protein [Candidatus Litorirhabdus singularis]
MLDKYPGYAALAECEQEGKDFVIKYQDRGSDVLLMAPHAGSIEPKTSEVVLAIAGEEISYYLFEGIKPCGNWDLHITSTNFDEPQAVRLAQNCQSVVTIHGEGSESIVAFLGGRNVVLRDSIANSLNDAGFVTGRHDNPRLQGESKNNICNRSANGAGVQLELGRGLRRLLFGSDTLEGHSTSTVQLKKFAAAVRKGLRPPQAT